MFDYLVLRWISWHNWREETMKDKVLLSNSKIGGNCPGWVDSYWEENCVLLVPKMKETFRIAAHYGGNMYRDIPYYGKKKILHNTPWKPDNKIPDLSKKNTQYFKNKKIEVDECENVYNMYYYQCLVDGSAIDKLGYNKYNPIVENLTTVKTIIDGETKYVKKRIKIWKPEGFKYGRKLIDDFIKCGITRFLLGNEIDDRFVNFAANMYHHLIKRGIDKRDIVLGFQHGSDAWMKFKQICEKPYKLKTDCFTSVHQVIKNNYVPKLITGQYITRRFFLSTDGDKPRPTKEKIYDYYKPLFKLIPDKDDRRGRMRHVASNKWGFEVLNHSKDGVEDSMIGLSKLYKETFGKYPENYGKFPKKEEPHADIPYSDSPPHADSPPPTEPDPPSFWERLWEWIKGIFGG
jgi:hypothetical protein